MEPALEELLGKIDSGKFELATLAARRARQINAYYNQLGEGLGAYVPPQVTSQGKPLTIAFEEIGEGKLVPGKAEDVVETPAEDEAPAEA